MFSFYMEESNKVVAVSDKDADTAREITGRFKAKSWSIHIMPTGWEDADPAYWEGWVWSSKRALGPEVEQAGEIWLESDGKGFLSAELVHNGQIIKVVDSVYAFYINKTKEL